VKQVTIDRDHAQAQVEFHVKNGPGTMQLTYALAKRDGAWSVSNPGLVAVTSPIRLSTKRKLQQQVAQ